MYLKKDYKKDILKIIEKQGYNSVNIAKLTYEIFMSHQRDVDNHLYNQLLDIANMEMGPEFEMTEAEFNEYIEKM